MTLFLPSFKSFILEALRQSPKGAEAREKFGWSDEGAVVGTEQNLLSAP